MEKPTLKTILEMIEKYHKEVSINSLLTEREVCTVKYQTEVFQYGPSDEGARSVQKTEV